ncbi:MAG TPA: hypothetical protein VFT06_09850, partial [Flavisolibacter sp.]|nr:hypothetical protein [Flavisolibacter sp.]
MDNQDISLLLQRTAELERALAAKNRELEIEAALENVRSRSLAMQQSEELKDVVQVVFDNLQHLGFVFDDGAVSILLFKEGSRDHLQWTADPRQAYAVPLDVRYTDHSIPASLMEAKESGVNFFAKLFPVEEKNAYFNYLFAHSNYRDMPEAVKQLILGSEHYGYSVAFARQSAILIPTNSGRLVTGEQKETLIRFAKVFEQAYIRFLDLQKAEAQAREAQVEAALERVRSRTMAMQRSGELSAVATVLFQQVKALGVPQWTCGFCIWDIGDTECMWYPGSPDGEILPPGRFPLTEHPVFKLMDESRKRGDELYVFEKEGELQADHYRYLMTLPGIRELLQDMLDSGLTIPTFQIDHYANFAYGNLIFITYEHFPEMHDIFKRFAKVFEQTYTRFLDLQKAEAQAREAQIEAALERVRARTMAMQKSGELTEVAELLFKQVNNLGIQTCTTGFNVWSDDNNSWVDYVTNPQGGFLEPYTVAATQFPVFVEVSDARKRGDEFYVQSVAGELLKETYEHLSRFGEKQFKAILDSGFQFPSKQIHHFVFGSKVSLMFITYEPVPEAHDLFKRFGKVFEQTFTRFLDLQKAEASAREAEIEAGLERVRAAANAMHKSTELLNVISALSEQFQQLGFTIDSANFNTSYREKDWNLWLYNPGFPMYSDKV